jgi:hypothetical protein
MQLASCRKTSILNNGHSSSFFLAVLYLRIYGHIMKTTIDFPDAILERTKIAAVRRRTSIFLFS